MMKQLVALAATALFSLNASASYVQWNVSSPELSGYIVQNEQDLSIAYFELYAGSNHATEHVFAPSYGYNDIAWVKARYNNQGPSRFEIADDDTEGASFHITFNFSGTGDPDQYRFTSYYLFKQVWSPVPWYHPAPVVHYPAGTVTRGTVDPALVASLDWYLDNSDGALYDSLLRHLVPELHVIPEPASIALLGLGAAGLAGAARRRKRAHALL